LPRSRIRKQNLEEMRRIKKIKQVKEEQVKAFNELNKKRKLSQTSNGFSKSKNIANGKRLKSTPGLDKPKRTSRKEEVKLELFHSMLPYEYVKLLGIFVNQFCNDVTMSKASQTKDANAMIDRQERFSNSKQILIVLDHLNPQRSPKTLLSIVYNIPIVGMDWI
jgi:hypothetical protein